MFVYALFIVMFLAIILKLNFDKQRLYITYDSVDDSIVSALVAASTYNLEEYGLGGQTVIYDTVTEIEAEEPLLPGQTPPPMTEEELEEERALQAMEKALENLQDIELFNPVTDSYLNKSRSDFLRTLKRNLKLDNNMVCQLSGIEGSVSVVEFSVYNKFEQFDEDGNLLAYRIIKYTHNGNAWNVYAYDINSSVSVYNSYDNAYTPVENTTVTAKLSFDLRLSDYNAELYQGLTEADMLQAVSYQRVVDIKQN